MIKNKKPLKKISNKKRERLKKWESEKALFLAIWQSRWHFCEICGKQIHEPKSWCFAHRLSKWRYPEYRLYDKNIALVCSIDCHHTLDSQNIGKDIEIINNF